MDKSQKIKAAVAGSVLLVAALLLAYNFGLLDGLFPPPAPEQTFTPEEIQQLEQAVEEAARRPPATRG